MIAARLPLLPPFRWRLRPVPLGLDYPYWIDDPDFDLDGRLDFGIVADREQMRDVWSLIGWLGEALDELRPVPAPAAAAA